MSGLAINGFDGAAGYERLRRGALGESVDEPGLVLLMRRGLRAWLEARDGRETTTAPIGPAIVTEGGAANSKMRQELAHLMATMLLGAVRKEVRS